MADSQTTIQDLLDFVSRFEAERDWAQFHAPKNLAMGLAIETAELMEHFLWTTTEESRQVQAEPERLRQVKDEMADILAYLLMLAHTLGVDLSDAFYAKMAQTAQKYPVDKYKGKYKL